MKTLCPICGASWECEHQPDPARAELEYIPVDGPTLADRKREMEALLEEVRQSFIDGFAALAVAMRAAAQSVDDFAGLWDRLPEETKRALHIDRATSKPHSLPKGVQWPGQAPSK